MLLVGAVVLVVGGLLVVVVVVGDAGGASSISNVVDAGGVGLPADGVAVTVIVTGTPCMGLSAPMVNDWAWPGVRLMKSRTELAPCERLMAAVTVRLGSG